MAELLLTVGETCLNCPCRGTSGPTMRSLSVRHQCGAFDAWNDLYPKPLPACEAARDKAETLSRALDGHRTRTLETSHERDEERAAHAATRKERDEAARLAAALLTILSEWTGTGTFRQARDILWRMRCAITPPAASGEGPHRDERFPCGKAFTAACKYDPETDGMPCATCEVPAASGQAGEKGAVLTAPDYPPCRIHGGRCKAGDRARHYCEKHPQLFQRGCDGHVPDSTPERDERKCGGVFRDCAHKCAGCPEENISPSPRCPLDMGRDVPRGGR